MPCSARGRRPGSRASNSAQRSRRSRRDSPGVLGRSGVVRMSASAAIRSKLRYSMAHLRPRRPDRPVAGGAAWLGAIARGAAPVTGEGRSAGGGQLGPGLDLAFLRRLLGTGPGTNQPVDHDALVAGETGAHDPQTAGLAGAEADLLGHHSAV